MKCRAGTGATVETMNRSRTHRTRPKGQRPRCTLGCSVEFQECSSDQHFRVEVKGLEPSASTLRINNGHFRHLV